MEYDRHVVVTGASSGIGRALARAFDRPGTAISLVARREELLRELQTEIATRSEVVPADLSDASEPTRWLRAAEDTLGPTDVLVNNAGMSFIEPVAGIGAERIARIFQINVHTPIAAMHHVMGPMVARGRGTIVNVASNAAFQPAPYLCHYTATKGALGNFSEALRMELKGTGVHVVTVYPGPIETPMADRNWKQFADARAFRRMSPIGDTTTLAARIVSAVAQRRARVIYPRFYALGWWLPGIGRFVAEHLTPAASGRQTPEL